MRGRLFAVLAFTLATSLAAATGAEAASAACARLKAQLASAPAGTIAPSEHRRYADAVARQREQMRKVQSDLTRFGCTSGSFIVVNGRNAAACQKLSAAQVKMRANLAGLERKRDTFAGRGSAQARRRIEAALKANDCDNTRPISVAARPEPQRPVATPAVAAPEPRRERPGSPGLVAVIGKSGGSEAPGDPARDFGAVLPSGARIVVEPRPSGAGNLRTLCVRTCDGYFFPISSQATAQDFARDEKTCKMMCPGTQAELYFHAVPDEESEAMVSARTQEPYTDLPTAFSYRSTTPAMSKRTCSCNMAAFYEEMERREAIYNGTYDQAPETTWVLPAARPDPGEDPETVANGRAALSQSAIAAVADASTRERPMTEADRKVRVVGPAFLPDQSEKLDLTAGADRLFR